MYQNSLKDRYMLSLWPLLFKKARNIKRHSVFLLSASKLGIQGLMFCSVPPQLKYRKIFNPSRPRKFGYLSQKKKKWKRCSASLASLKKTMSIQIYFDLWLSFTKAQGDATCSAPCLRSSNTGKSPILWGSKKFNSRTNMSIFLTSLLLPFCCFKNGRA